MGGEAYRNFTEEEVRITRKFLLPRNFEWVPRICRFQTKYFYFFGKRDRLCQFERETERDPERERENGWYKEKERETERLAALRER